MQIVSTAWNVKSCFFGNGKKKKKKKKEKKKERKLIQTVVCWISQEDAFLPMC